MMTKTFQATSAVGLIACLLLAGCGSLVGEKRHSPADIARYQPADFAAPIASAPGRAAALQAARDHITRAMLDPSNDAAVADALWAVQFLNAERSSGLAITQSALQTLAGKPAAFQRAVLSTAHALYSSETAAVILALLPHIATPREFAVGAYAVLQGTPGSASTLLDLLQGQFPQWREEPRLVALQQALAVATQAVVPPPRPALTDLLAAPIRAGWPVVFSFQRKDRRHFGLAVVRGADGRFVRKPDGSIFNVAQLALALTNLPGTITNGNTPQGLFTIVGAGTATNPWIGPTPFLHAKVPVEATVAEYAHVETAEEWSEAVYDSFLPASWRGYFPFKEAWLAGRAGRDEMLVHGTTIATDLYRDTPWYPGTPSAGCLVAMEYWAADGRLVHSDQLALAKAFTASGHDRGYLVVVELDDRAVPVSLAEVMPDLLAAEARTAAAGAH